MFISGASPAPSSACEDRLRGRLSDLESLKSGKDRTKPWTLFVYALERTKRDGFTPRTEPPPAPFSALLRVRDGYSSRRESLIFANLIALVAADSDLTSLQKENSLKEVIQPHLPVRLPCYDFTPLTGHSFGASVPYGFGQRLREHQTRVM